MSEFSWSIIVIGTYRIITLLAGLLSIYLGYKLFRVGIYEKAGDLKATWGSSNLVLKQAAPGTFFALFGAAVISFGIWKGVSVQSSGRALQPVAPPPVSRDLQNAQPGGGETPNTEGSAAQSGASKKSGSESDVKSKSTIGGVHPSLMEVSPPGQIITMSQIKPIIDKTLLKQPLSDEERQTLEQWWRNQQIFNNYWGIEANRPAQDDRPTDVLAPGKKVIG